MKNKIHLLSIEFENFLCFREKQSFKFHSSGIHRIYGKNLDLKPIEEDDETLEHHNSGSGKSSFLAGVTFGLFGEIAKDINKNDVVNKTAGKDCSVSIEFEKENIRYKIERYRKHKKKGNKLYFFKLFGNDWIDESEDDLKFTQEKINNILMMNYDTFMKVGLISRDGSKEFSELPTHERRTLLENVIRLDKFFAFEKTIKDKVYKLNKDLDSNYLNIASSESSLNTLTKVIKKQISSVRNNLNNLILEEAEIENKIKEIKNSINNFNEIDSILSDCKEYLNYLKNLNLKIEEYNLHLKNNLHLKEEISKSLKNYFNYSSLIIKRKNRMNKISAAEQKCPKCSEILNKQEIENEIKDNQNFILDLNEDKKNISIRIKETIKKYRDKKQQLKLEKNEIESEKNKQFQISKELKKIIQKDFKNGKDISFIEDLKKLNNELILKRKEKQKINYSDIKDTRKSISLNRVQLRKLKFVQLELQEQLEIAEFWNKAFDHKNEDSIKAFILMKIVPVFNLMLQNFLNKAFDGKLFMTFDSTFNETISYNGELFEFRELSTGERKQINLIINFTILSLVRLNLNSFNVLFLDEIFTSLDTNFIKKIINMLLTNFLSDSVLYVISHDNIDYLKVDSKITILKENKESTIIMES